MDHRWTGTIVIGVVLVAVAAVYSLAKVQYGLYSPSHITVFNRSDEPVSDVRLRHGDRELALGAIDRGQSQSAYFIIAHEGSLTLTVTFNSRRSMSAEKVGYVTPGMPVTVIFEITDDKVALVAALSRASRPYSNR